tara:strand:+ start:186489 stop:186854 length:366 start_codon:yes stop_codon:yes gene_type:complete
MNRLLVFLLLAGCQTTIAASDLVNERLTASTAAMEDHWGVDCGSTLGSLTTPIALVPMHTHGALAEALTKCRYIHQPPGKAHTNGCRDYAALQQAWITADDAALIIALEPNQNCIETMESK